MKWLRQTAWLVLWLACPAIGSSSNSTHNRNETTTADPTTDPANKCRKQARDALGRIVAVTEDACAGGANHVTSYTYDGEGRLLTVTQGTQTRVFTYDLLGRLLTANNPESGLISYAYDLNGNLISRQDSRPALSCFGVITGGVCNGATGYDALNRPLTKQNANPSTASAAQIETITYCYDGRTKSGNTCAGAEAPLQLGQLTSVGNGNSATDFTYDAVGRMTASSQRTGTLMGTSRWSAPRPVHWAAAGGPRP